MRLSLACFRTKYVRKGDYCSIPQSISCAKAVKKGGVNHSVDRFRAGKHETNYVYETKPFCFRPVQTLSPGISASQLPNEPVFPQSAP